MQRFEMIGVIALTVGCGGETPPAEVPTAALPTSAPAEAAPEVARDGRTVIIAQVDDVGRAFGRLSRVVNDVGGERLMARSDGPRMVVSFDGSGTALDAMVEHLDEVGDVVRIAGELGGTHVRRITVLLMSPDPS